MNIVINHAIAVGKNKIKTIRQDFERNLGGNKVIAEDSRFYLGKKVDISFKPIKGADHFYQNFSTEFEDSIKNYINENITNV